jgi:type 1 fimbriae regulatory protein FimB
MLRKYDEKAQLPEAVHPQMVRYACGFALADQDADTRLIQYYLAPQHLAQRPLYRHESRSIRGVVVLETVC